MRNLAILLGAAAAIAVPRLAAAQDPSQEKQAASPLATPATKLFGVQVSGDMTMNYRLRWSDGERDQDLYEYFHLVLGDRDIDPVHAHFFLRVSEDIDGDHKVSQFFPFSDVTNSFRSRVNERLYYGYVDVNRFGPVNEVRIGRQFRYETPVPVYFDGVTAASIEFPAALGSSFGAYGGVPVHLYESPSGGDSLEGAWVQARPWKGARARIDFANIRDSLLTGTETDTIWTVNAWQNFADSVQLQYRHTFLDARNRDLLAKVSIVESRLGFQTQASFHYLMETQKRETTDLDFFTSVQEYSPFWETRLLVSQVVVKDVMEDIFVVDAGLDIRELIDRDKVSEFNHEFRHFFVTPSISEWPAHGLGMSVTGEFWDVAGGGHGDFATAGMEAHYRVFESVKISGETLEEERYRTIERFRVSAGWEYSLYKSDVLANEERENVRTYFLRAFYTSLQRLKIDVAIEFEDGEQADYAKLKVGTSQSF